MKKTLRITEEPASGAAAVQDRITEEPAGGAAAAQDSDGLAAQSRRLRNSVISLAVFFVIVAGLLCLGNLLVLGDIEVRRYMLTVLLPSVYGKTPHSSE